MLAPDVLDGSDEKSECVAICDRFGLRNRAARSACEEALLEASCHGRGGKFIELLMASDLIRANIVLHALVTACCRGFTDAVDTLLKVPPVSGKRSLLRLLQDDEKLMIRIDIYVGHEEGGQLTEAAGERGMMVIRNIIATVEDMAAADSPPSSSTDEYTTCSLGPRSFRKDYSSSSSGLYGLLWRIPKISMMVMQSL
ncbi:hypothetical protein HanOQP8_Chr02g0040461 [Helianthus annuus]|nr:hypothetical protein HanOQP8_Chr02g0040461 [Helianthus annuus]